MSAEPAGAIAIWHDIVLEGLDEFYAWHGEEHMPERVSIPGFLCGRRFVAVEAALGFFNLYDTASYAVVAGSDYKNRLDNPTPRTLSAVRHFRNVARSLCRVEAKASAAERGAVAQGGAVATLRYDVRAGREADHLAIMKAYIEELATIPSVASVSLLTADRATSGYVNAEQRARGAANQVPPFILLAEGWGSEQDFISDMRIALSADRCMALHIEPGSAMDFYRHQLTIAPK